MRATHYEDGDWDDGLHVTVWAVKLLTLAQAARSRRKKKGKTKKKRRKTKP